MDAASSVPARIGRRLCLAAALIIATAWAAAHADPVRIVAAESVYGDICKRIGGEHVAVVSILSIPAQDPHAFEVGASAARDVALARMVVYNGAGYDPWMAKAAAASPSASRRTIDVARLVGRKPGDNPHLWYDTAAVSAFARACADALAQIDPSQRDDYAQRHSAFEASMSRLGEHIASFRRRHAGTAVTATEPIFDYMAEALGLSMRNRRFQLAVMNATEPSARDIAAFEDDLRSGRVRALIFNPQTGGALADRMRGIAAAANVPVVAATETQPAGSTYEAWMQAQIDALDAALSERR